MQQTQRQNTHHDKPQIHCGECLAICLPWCHVVRQWCCWWWCHLALLLPNGFVLFIWWPIFVGAQQSAHRAANNDKLIDLTSISCLLCIPDVHETGDVKKDLSRKCNVPKNELLSTNHLLWLWLLLFWFSTAWCLEWCQFCLPKFEELCLGVQRTCSLNNFWQLPNQKHTSEDACELWWWWWV